MDRYFLEKKGFSLVEISICLTVLGLLLLIFLPTGVGIISNSKVQKNTKDINYIAHACQQYYRQHNHWPVEANDLKPFFISPSVPTNNYFLTPQNNILFISSATDSVTVVRPRGVIGYLDYQ